MARDRSGVMNVMLCGILLVVEYGGGDIGEELWWYGMVWRWDV